VFEIVLKRKSVVVPRMEVVFTHEVILTVIDIVARSFPDKVSIPLVNRGQNAHAIVKQ
jgi:hypothetical protein